MSIGSVLNETYEYYRRAWRHYALLGGALFIVIGVLVALAQHSRAHREGAIVLVWWVIATVVTIVGTAWLQAVVTVASNQLRNGLPFPSMQELRHLMQPLYMPVLSAALSASLLVYALSLPLYVAPALLVLVLPLFIFLLTRWVVLIPMVVTEGTPNRQLLRRANELSKGKFFDLMLLTLMSVVLIGVSSIAAGVIASFLPEFGRVWFSTFITGALAIPPIMVAWTVTYFQLARHRAVPLR